MRPPLTIVLAALALSGYLVSFNVEAFGPRAAAATQLPPDLTPRTYYSPYPPPAVTLPPWVPPRPPVGPFVPGPQVQEFMRNMPVCQPGETYRLAYSDTSCEVLRCPDAERRRRVGCARLDEVQAFFAAAFKSMGLEPPPFGSSGGPTGFQDASAARTTSFCQETTGLRLSVSVRALPTGANDVRVSTQNGAPAGGVCWPVESTGRGRFQGPRAGIPPLFGPPGAQIQPGMTSTGGTQWGSAAMAITEWSASELDGLFSAQLAAVGWTRVGRRASGALAWSTWDVPGEGPWHGMLLIFDLPGENRRGLSLRVESSSPDMLGFSAEAR